MSETTIGHAKLSRIESDLHRLRRHPNDGPMLSRFEYDHSHTLVVDSHGKRDLLIENTKPLASDIARLLQHCNPALIGELVRGYRMAKAAGLLGDGEAIKEIRDNFTTSREASVTKARPWGSIDLTKGGETIRVTLNTGTNSFGDVGVFAGKKPGKGLEEIKGWPLYAIQTWAVGHGYTYKVNE